MELYRQLVEVVDRLAAQLTAHYGSHLVCRAGCSGCCHHHLSIFAVEAAAVGEAVQKLSREKRARIQRQARQVREREARGEPVACPLLVDECCSIYESRPIICRTQGLPLLIEAEDGTREVDFCRLNFTAPGATDELDEAHLVPLELLNLKLALVNRSYCRQKGLDEATSGYRRKISDIILDS